MNYFQFDFYHSLWTQQIWLPLNVQLIDLIQINELNDFNTFIYPLIASIVLTTIKCLFER
jgi:hypothetical protein